MTVQSKMNTGIKDQITHIEELIHNYETSRDLTVGEVRMMTLYKGIVRNLKELKKVKENRGQNVVIEMSHDKYKELMQTSY